MSERINIFKKSKKEKNDAVRFWMDAGFYDRMRSYENVSGYSLDKLLSLTTIKKTIENFVHITSEKSVKVSYFGSDSYVNTDGGEVTISANLDDFDSVVGLALHESSHISFSELNIYKMLFEKLKDCVGNKTWSSFHFQPKIQQLLQKYFDIIKNVEKKPEFPNRQFDVAMNLFEFWKGLINWIEDRRIDFKQAQRFPGYVAYYDKLYSTYFYNDETTKGLMSELFRTTTFESYEYRIVNSINDASDPKALPKLEEILEMLSQNNINKCNNNWETASLSLDVFEIIFNECKNNIFDSGSAMSDKTIDNLKSKKTEKSEAENKPETEKSEAKAENKESAEKSEESESIEKSESKNITKANRKSEPKPMELTDAEKRDILKVFEGTKSLINQVDENNKTEMDKESTSKIGLLEKGILNILNLTDIKTSIISIGEVNSEVKSTFSRLFNWNDQRKNYINRGIAKGVSLGKKLQIMNDTKLFKTVRKENGTIDNRLLSEIGFGNTRIFAKTRVEQYNKLYVHLTLDSSGSMDGENWSQTLHMAAAIASALSYVEGAHVVVTTRATFRFNGMIVNENPFIMTIYDSFKNDMRHIRKWWHQLEASGNTPEGLVFDGIMKRILKDANGKDSYFINVSDGMPSCSSQDWTKSQYTVGYRSEMALDHTRKQINKIAANGIAILSYLIGGKNYRNTNFERMYGKHAHYINVTDMMELARTLNKKFMERAKK